YLQEVLGYSSLKAGFAFLPMPTTVFIVSQLTSRKLSDLVPAKVLMLTGVALGTVGFVLAAGLGEHSSYLHVFGCLILFAIGNGMSFVPLTQAALAGVPPQDAGAASGLVNVTQQLGGALGVSVLVTVAGSSAHTPHQLVIAATDAFAGAAVFLAAAFVLVVALVRAPKAVSH
ncbi:MAG: transporter, partial [Frankiales bacterium]|nr:transporter [Frankiales bacterium]